MDNLLTVKEVQEKLRLGENNTYKLISSKGFPKIQIGRKYLVPESELEKYMKEHLRSKIIL